MSRWVRWHEAYDDLDGGLAHRLHAVQEQVGAALDRCAPGPVRLLSLCAGAGRDVLPVLATHRRAPDIGARLVELDPALCARVRAEAASVAGSAVEVVEADAGSTATCAGAVPADVLLLCGIFGNVPDADVAATCAAVPSLLAAGGTVIWTRHTRPPDLTPSVRCWLAAAGLAEVGFVTGSRPEWAVGAAVLRGPASPFAADRRLFTFVDR